MFAEWLRRSGSPANFAASRPPPHPRFVQRLVVVGSEMEQSSTLQAAAEPRAAELLLPEDISTPDTSPKTPPARSRVCSEAEEEGAAKMVRVSTGSELTRVSPSRLRMIARSRLKLPPFVSQVNLPLLEVVTAASFLAWHAGKLVLFHNLREVRTRKTRKIGLTTEDIIVALAGNSQAEVPGKSHNWRDRLGICHAVSRIFADAYQLGRVSARGDWQKLWHSAPPVVRENWCHLLSTDAYGTLSTQAAVPTQDGEALPCEECCGCMLTWQSCLGRGDDVVRHWLSHDISERVLLELMQGDATCQALFKAFLSFLQCMVRRTGFTHHAAAMELNSEDRSTCAVVHFHAYCCVDWEVRKPDLLKVNFVRKDWQYDGYAPHVKFTMVKRNADPKKLMTQGLFYCASRKVGSVFQFSSCSPGKDRCVQRLLLLAGSTKRPHMLGSLSVWAIRMGRRGQWAPSPRALALLGPHGVTCWEWEAAPTWFR